MPKKVQETAEVVEENSVETEEVEVQPHNVLDSDFTELLGALKEAGALIAGLRSRVKALEKRTRTTLKAAHKTKRRTRGTGKPSGFTKPTRLSDEFCDFLGVEHGTELARTEGTRRLSAYVRDNNLYNPENKREIRPDKKLSKLLNLSKKLKKGETLTYFNLQRYVKHLYLPAQTA